MKRFILFSLIATMLCSISYASPPDIPKPDIVKMEKASVAIHQECFVMQDITCQHFAVDMGYVANEIKSLSPAPANGLAVECIQANFLLAERRTADANKLSDHALKPLRKYGSKEGTARLIKYRSPGPPLF